MRREVSRRRLSDDAKQIRPMSDSRTLFPASVESRRRVYAFSGGGTGGHLMPGLALAAALRDEDPHAEIQFVGSGKSLEKDLVTRQGYAHLALPVEPLPTLKQTPWRFLWRNWQAYRLAADWLTDHQPQCVIGLGGYASAPLVLAAARRSIPAILIEQNVIPGRATRWLAPRTQGVVVSFAETGRTLQGTIYDFGTPVRTEIARLAAEERYDPPEGEASQLLILGGSQGAATLNEAVLQATAGLRDELRGWRILHQTGTEQADAVRDRYAGLGLAAEVSPFIADMGECYRRTTLVISRAGATTLAELACAGLPALLVPFPFAADDHQSRNAELFVRAGAARMVVQEHSAEETATRLKGELLPLLQEARHRQAVREQMRRLARPDATSRVVGLIRELCGRGQTP